MYIYIHILCVCKSKDMYIELIYTFMVDFQAIWNSRFVEVCWKEKRFPLLNSRLNARFPMKIRRLHEGFLGKEKTSKLFIPHFSKFAEKQDVSIYLVKHPQYDQGLKKEGFLALEIPSTLIILFQPTDQPW